MNRAEFLLAAVAAPFGLRDPPAPLALATADDEAHVAAVDMRAGTVVRRIATRAGPRSIERVGESALAAHWLLGELTVIDTRSLEVRYVLGGFEEPRYTAASPDGRHAFVTDSGRVEVAAVDVVRGRVVSRLKLREWPRHLSLSPDGRTLWVGLGTASRDLAVVDVSDPGHMRLRGTVRPPFLLHDVGFEPTGRRVWVTAGETHAISVHDSHDGRVLHRLAADLGPQHVTFLGRRAFVTSGAEGTLHVYDEPSARLLASTRIPAGSYNVQFAAGRVLTPSLNGGTLCILDTQGRIRTEVRVSASSHDACLARA
jgi:DNA-binding beta-propeller fold protein YncE